MKILSLRTLTGADVAALGNNAVSLTARREYRKRLLAAFDIYKQNVGYGIIEETPEIRGAVLAWYQNLLDLDASAFTEIPAPVAAYLEGGVSHA